MTGARAARRRLGFTLVELLVVIALIIVIAALTVAVANSGIIGSQKVVSGSDRASGWLLISRQRAMRDQAPRGVRFFLSQPDSANPTLFAATEAQYIEAPPPWVPNPYGPGRTTDRQNTANNTFYNGSNLGRIVFLYTADALSPNSPTNGVVINRRVFFVSDDPNDMSELDQRLTGTGNLLLLPDFPTPFQIKSASPLTGTTTINLQNQNYGPNSNVRELTLESYPELGAAFSQQQQQPNSPQLTCYVTYRFAFQEAARPLLGEPTLQLTGGTIIDYRAPGPNGYNTTTPPYNPPTTLGVTVTGGFFDVLFGANGQVMYNPSPLICLWVRDADKLKDLGNNPRLQGGTVDPPRSSTSPFDNAGDQFLVTIYPKTGFIATHPVAPPTGPGSDPYQYAKDGLNSGF